jgi:hypothetical protein
MTPLRPAHPLDVDLADLVDGLLGGARLAAVEAHLPGCLHCRLKVHRLREAGLGPLGEAPLPSLPSLPFPVPERHAGSPSPGDVRLAGEGERLLLVVLRVDGDRALVAPVTLDVEAADDETVLVDSPLGAGLAAHLALSTHVPAAVLGPRLAAISVPVRGPTGTPITDAGDPRLEVRQELADRLTSLGDPPPDADPPPPGPEQIRSSLVADLRALRGDSCTVRPLFAWSDVLPAGTTAGWEPLLVLDELGVVLVVLDTPHGLVDDDDYSRARTVLTRLNGTALVVLSSAVGDLADVFDAPSLNHGIDAPSGRHSPPRPLIGDLSPFDAIGKFLDRTTGVRATTPSARGPVARVDVGDILRQAATDALADAVRQGGRYKIASKRRGYETLAGMEDGFAAALARAFDTDAAVAEALLSLAREDGA